MSPKGTILLTGGSGFLGFHILKEALAQRYFVRIVVRSEAKADTLRNNRVLASLGKSSSYSFHIVPDLAAPGALDEPARGADSIIHAASPLPWNAAPEAERYEKVVVPAVDSVIAVLETAKRTRSVKRVVYTSSMVAVIPPHILFGPVPSDKVWQSSDRFPMIDPPYPEMGVAYVASKVGALHAVEAWLDENKGSIHFDVVSLAAPYIIGRNDLIDDSEALESNTSNARWFALLKGNKISETPVANSSVAVEDCAKMHVLALDDKLIKPGDSQVIGFGVDFDWNDMPKIAAEKYPQAVEKGWIKLGVDQPTNRLTIDNSHAEGVFGIKLKGVDAMVESLAGQWVELLEKENK